MTSSSESRQIVLDLPALAPRMTRAEFVISESNRATLETLDAWMRAAEPMLTICGPEGSGKTHILQMLTRETAAAGTPIIAVDDVHLAGDPQDILALIERARGEGRRIAFAGRGAPTDWARGLKDLGTRLNAAARITMREPDDALLSAVILKLFRDRQLKAAPEVADYAVRRLPGTFAAAQAFVGALDAASIEKARPIGLKLAREAVANLSEEPSSA
ncbi:MAG TPA: hypothetical protein PKH09_02565 [Parvularculaceae bacterium]|nr:hypothetical protein [Parvularculaceae bacterium]